jgi:small-conductance mechanosensitive channel
MKASQKLILVGLVILAGAVVAGLVLTGSRPSTGVQTNGQRAPVAQEPVVDEQGLVTARRLAGLAATPEEQKLAQDAMRVADRELDLAFGVALRVAGQQPSSESAETRASRERIQQVEAEIKSDEEDIKQLTAQAAGATGADQDELHQQIELAQAELALDQDTLADAKEDLDRAGGDAYTKLKRFWEEHEAAEHTNAAPPGSGALPTAFFSAGSLIARWRNWSAVRTTGAQLLEAQQDALKDARTLSSNHQALEQQVREEQSSKKAPALEAARLPQTGEPGSGTPSKRAAGAALSLLRRLSQDEKNLADMDKRVQDLEELSSVYGRWRVLVKVRERASLHDILKSALWIILTVLSAFFVGRLIDRSFARVTLERKQLVTLRGVVRFTVEALAVLVILLVVFGSPNNMSTALGLAGAGLTVALKDFIVSFFGWFVLMGRDGLRVGDWVEINGVRGEVIEIGLLRTVLLETGNWTEPGRPTGRQVSFLNSFAVEGYYFNFTTSGQWLWDEIQLLIPWSTDPYPLVDKISDMVTKETERNVQMAEQDWQRVTRRYGVKPLSATPSVNVKSTDEGVEVTVRYITRAAERSELRSRLNHAAVKLIHGGKAAMPPPEAAPREASPDQRSDH